MIKKRGADLVPRSFYLISIASIVRSSLCSAMPTNVWTASVMCLMTWIGSSGNHRFSDLLNAFITKLGMIDVLGFVQAIGEEEDGGGSL